MRTKRTECAALSCTYEGVFELRYAAMARQLESQRYSRDRARLQGLGALKGIEILNTALGDWPTLYLKNHLEFPWDFAESQH